MADDVGFLGSKIPKKKVKRRIKKSPTAERDLERMQDEVELKDRKAQRDSGDNLEERKRVARREAAARYRKEGYKKF